MCQATGCYIDTAHTALYTGISEFALDRSFDSFDSAELDCKDNNHST